MTLQEILDDIDARLPNTFTPAQKVLWMNNKLDKIWPHVVFADSYEFNTIENTQAYELPGYIKLQYIENVFVSKSTVIDSSTEFQEYFYSSPNKVLSGYKFFDSLGSLGLHPVPDASGYLVRIKMKAKPTKLSAGSLGSIPEFDEEVQDILTYEVMRIISESPPYESAARATYYQNEVDKIFDLILERELRYKIAMGDKAKANSWWYRRR
jgi:hypothetical protein